ncbi:MAG: tRNA (N6-threonylcarbamoyladenosine(37)-N6)-methyltransferase TrmO [Lachnospiraceae bacterium]|nr:tRNA (N6-threonylcarbamoyladenosine(37)-N6)-methyltransferase TrmO [Lachnospiraceae bacterium]MBP5702769.1 tRNA (N6-threonylcarbamoyladenosine(37)-N6)-methyltransferase TrmO [Lachnospiraceae bacterium]
MEIIAYYKSDMPEKFGVPRQSGLAPHLKGRIVFEEKYSDQNAFDGLEGFDRIWIIWRFDVKDDDSFRAKVRPPRLGGNTYMGVFATRSPFRPNHLGLTCAKIEGFGTDENGRCYIDVSGADMTDGTEVYDVKPYLPYADAYPDARGGFAQEEENREHRLSVTIPDEIRANFPNEQLRGLVEVLSLDPRPSYHDDPNRVYGLSYAGCNIRFSVNGSELTVLSLS